MRASNLLLVITTVIGLSVSVGAQELITPAATEASPLTSELLTLDRAISVASTASIQTNDFGPTTIDDIRHHVRKRAFWASTQRGHGSHLCVSAV